MSIACRRRVRGSVRRPQSSGVAYRIACGQTAPITSGGAPAWTADNSYSGGSSVTTQATIDLSGASNPAPMAVYQSERWTNGTLSYTLSGLVAGTSYTIRLHFAEVYYTGAGQRVMNISAEGATLITGFDIYAAAGGMNRAVSRQVTAVANTSGAITLSLSATSSGNDPKINGIEVIGAILRDNTPRSLTPQVFSTYALLSWGAPLQPTGTITGYVVYQNGVKLTTNPITTTQYRPGQDSAALSNSTAYTFRVVTVIDGGETQSASVNVTTTSGQVTGPIKTTSSFTGSQGQTINFGVRLPNNYYTSGQQYPVLYSLHGRDDTYATFLDTSETALRPSIDAGILSECIIVTPDSFYTGRWEDGAAGPAETNFLQLIPYIEAHYNAKPGAAWRLLVGFSMGGHGAFLHGVKHRDMFAGVWSVDGAMSYNSADYTQYASGKTTADFHIRTLGGTLNGSRVQTVVNAFSGINITIPYVYYSIAHEFPLLVDADRNAGSPDMRFLQSRIGMLP